MKFVIKAWSRAKEFLRDVHPAKLAFLGYLSYIVIGWVILCVPWLQKGPGVGALDNLFISTSAVSTTGLATVSIADRYSFAGQVVVLTLIQLGGIGYMTLGSFVILSRRTDLSEVRSGIGRTVFSLPASFRVDKFIRSVIKFTLVIELAGAVALYFIFRRAGAPDAVWSAIFHSVSAFCTAGFSLYNDSFLAYAGNFWLVAVIAVLSYLGAIGFIVFVDYWRLFRGKISEVTLTSRIILRMTLWLTVGGTLLLFISEPSIQGKPIDERLMAAFFQAMTAMTTVGFNTVSIAALSKASLLLIVVLMVIGASPSGTGGGLKTTSFSAIIGVMRSAITGHGEVRFWGRPVPIERIWTAVAGLGFYISALVIGTYLLEITEPSNFLDNLFEAASALGTVGLSMGITPTLTNMGKLILILLMFCGRLGPLTFGIALFFRKGLQPTALDNDLAV
ncbi:MAG: Potassium/sodium uptake protein NtpJ [Phycisphaerae bacterium]|nr:Potassium/sodium uptake protein NtpJ [Phycisphaerae bacterium]